MTASGTDKCTGRSVSNEHRSTCPIQTLPGLEITFKCPEKLYSHGDAFVYRAVIKNVGNVRLENIRVFDTLTGNRLVWSRDSLSVGESHEMENYPIVPENCCAITTTLRAEAVDSCSQQNIVDTSTGTCPVLYHPKIAVAKTCPTRSSEPGDTLTFTGSVSNPGDVTLVDVNVVNVVNGKETKILGPIALAPGQVVNYKASFVVPEDFCGDNVIRATGQAFCGTKEVVSATDTSRCPITTMPMIVVTKECPTSPVSKGDVFNYAGTVMNAGNVTLTDVVVYDSRPAPKTQVFGPITLAPGETRNFTASYKLDTICCETWDTLTATGKDRCSGVVVENSATAVCPVLWTAKIEVTKQCRPDNSFLGFVKNSGTITLTNVTVLAQLGGANTALLGPIELAPGETANFSGKSAGDSLVVAKGTSLCQSVNVSAQANCAGPVPPAPLLIQNVQVQGGIATLGWQSTPGRFYSLEFKQSLGDSDWKVVPGEIQATRSSTSKTDINPDGTLRVYRIREIE